MARDGIPELLLVTMVAGMAAMLSPSPAVVEGQQQQVPACGSKLAGCALYLNGTTPPRSCCGPLNETILKERSCLCNLYDNPKLLTSIGINITQARLLPRNCKISGADNLCNNSSSSTPKSSPSKPSGAPASKNENEASLIRETGWLNSLILWACMMLLG